MGCKSFIIISLISVIAITSATSAEISPGEYRQLRREKAARPRRVLFNNDAADSRGNFTREEFLARRTDFTVGLVDTIMYCVGHAGFQQVVALPHGETSAYLKTVDVFQWLIDFAHANGQEVFCSFRMNDVHDWRHTEAKPRMSSWKKANRDVLFADSMENKTTLYGFWTAMDYGNAKVRDQHFAIVCDVLDKYDVDGLDFDFSRYLPLFREVSMGVPASPEQREQFTDLMRRTRRNLQ